MLEVMLGNDVSPSFSAAPQRYSRAAEEVNTQWLGLVASPQNFRFRIATSDIATTTTTPHAFAHRDYRQKPFHRNRSSLSIAASSALSGA
jgi:hypothetical protein